VGLFAAIYFSFHLGVIDYF